MAHDIVDKGMPSNGLSCPKDLKKPLSCFTAGDQLPPQEQRQVADTAAEQSMDLAGTAVWGHRLGGKPGLQCLSSDAQTWHCESRSPGVRRLLTLKFGEVFGDGDCQKDKAYKISLM